MAGPATLIATFSMNAETSMIFNAEFDDLVHRIPTRQYEVPTANHIIRLPEERTCLMPVPVSARESEVM